MILIYDWTKLDRDNKVLQVTSQILTGIILPLSGSVHDRSSQWFVFELSCVFFTLPFIFILPEWPLECILTLRSCKTGFVYWNTLKHKAVDDPPPRLSLSLSVSLSLCLSAAQPLTNIGSLSVSLVLLFVEHPCFVRVVVVGTADKYFPYNTCCGPLWRYEPLIILLVFVNSWMPESCPKILSIIVINVFQMFDLLWRGWGIYTCWISAVVWKQLWPL